MEKVNGGNVVEMTDITKRFPGVRALDGVSFDVRQGEIHALVGKNGAGKSTLVNILTGLYPPDSGTITIRGEVVEHMTTSRSQEAGIAIVAQHARFVPGLSVAENLFMGQMPTRQGGFVDWRGLRREASDRLARLGLHLDVTKRMEEMTVAERQLIEDLSCALRRRQRHHPRRAHGAAAQARGGVALRLRATPARSRRLLHLHLPLPRGDLRDRRSRHGPAQRRRGRHQGHRRPGPARAHPHDQRYHRGAVPATRPRDRRRTGAADPEPEPEARVRGRGPHASRR